MAICTVGGCMDGCEVVLLSLHYRGFSSVLVHRVAGSGTVTNPTDRSGRRSAAHVRTERWHASSARRCAHRGNQGSQNVTLSALSVESDQTQSMVVVLYDGTTTSGVTGSKPRRNSHDAGSGIRRRETSGEVGRKVVNREVGCTTGLSPVADGRDTTFRPLVSSVRCDASLVLMDGWAGRGRWRRGYILGEAALLERFDSW